MTAKRGTHQEVAMGIAWDENEAEQMELEHDCHERGRSLQDCKCDIVKMSA